MSSLRHERRDDAAVIASEAKQSSFLETQRRRKAGLLRRFAPRNDGEKRVRPRSAKRSRFCSLLPPSRSEGAGKAGCTLHPRSRVQKQIEKRTRAYRSAEAIRPSLRNGFTAYSALSPVSRALLPPSLRRSSPQSLAPASGARTTRLRRPLESRSSVATFASTASHRTFVTTRDPPLSSGETGEAIVMICPTG
jgi:hypothetical protein